MPLAENEMLGAAVINGRREVFAVVTYTYIGMMGKRAMTAEALSGILPGQ